MKKLAIVLGSCVKGGVTQALTDFIMNVSECGFSITLLLNQPDTVKNISLPAEVSVKAWSKKRNIIDEIKKRHIKQAVSLICYRTRTIWHWRNYPRKTTYEARFYGALSEPYDYVIAYHMNTNEDTVFALEKVNARRRILWIHGRKTYLEKTIRFFKKLYSKADQIVAVSKDTEDRFVRIFPELADKTTTIHNFYDFDAIYSKANESIEGLKSNGETVIVSTGRLSKEKGFDRVPAVTRKLVDDGYSIRWYIVGDGDQKDSIASAIKELGLEDHVILTGFIANPYPYVKQCDIYVQPSYTEGFCTSTMEAKILRRPVVTTDVPGMNEQFVNEYDGLIVESSVDGLYQGIKRMIDDKALYESIQDHLNQESFSNDEEMCKAIKAISG